MTAALLLAFLACTETEIPDQSRKIPVPAAPLSQPEVLCRAAARGRPCRTVAEVEKWLAHPDLEIVGAAAPPAGIQGVRVLTLRVPGLMPIVFRAKWRPQSTATKRNSPRRELAAYAVQSLFLEPDEYVVPPAAPHCFPLEAYRKAVDARARPSLGEVPCVYGILSYWLEDVQSLKDAAEAGWFHGRYHHAYDPRLFADNAAYRDSVSRVNLLTYLIAHADSHAKNFVITIDSAAPLVYSIDNSLSLGLAKNPRLDPKHDWALLKVPKLPRKVIERLRGFGNRADRLASIAELDEKGDRLVLVKPAARRPPTDGMDWVDGRMRIGLTAGEIADVRARIATLLRRVERGDIPLY